MVDQSAAPHGAAPVYRLFGVSLRSRFPFVSCLPAGQGPPDLTFSRAIRAPTGQEWQSGPPVFSSPDLTIDHESSAQLFRARECEVLRFGGSLDFFCWSDRIVAHVREPAQESLLEIRLLGPVMAYWLERRGIPVLHASSVETEGRAIALLAGSRGGKTSLAAALLQRGCRLLTDDLLPVETRGHVCLGRAGYPEMRMWPQEAEYFLGGSAGLKSVHPGQTKLRVRVGKGAFGDFHSPSTPLACIYLLERRVTEDRDDDVEILPIPPAEAIIELVGHSFSPLLVEAVGLQPERLEILARLVRRVAIRRLIYPAGFAHLSRACRLLLKDLEKL